MEDAGEDVAQAFDRITHSAAGRVAVPSPAKRRQLGLFSSGVWGLPTRNTLDRATVMLPDLMYRRLDELGIDFAVVYPTYGLMTAMPDAELRCALAHAVNRYYAEVYAGYRDRLEPVAAIPTHTPEEAIAELDHAVGELGLKAVMLGGIDPAALRRRRRAARVAGSTPSATTRLRLRPGLAPMRGARRRTDVPLRRPGLGNSHVHRQQLLQPGRQLRRRRWRARADRSSSVVYPSASRTLLFAFQEGGVAWAATLLAGIIGHWEKRNIDAIQHYNPAHLEHGPPAAGCSTSTPRRASPTAIDRLGGRPRDALRPRRAARGRRPIRRVPASPASTTCSTSSRTASSSAARPTIR